MIYGIAEVISHNGPFYRPLTFSDAAPAYLLRTQGLFFKKTEQGVVQWDWPGLADVKDPLL